MHTRSDTFRPAAAVTARRGALSRGLALTLASGGVVAIILFAAYRRPEPSNATKSSSDVTPQPEIVNVPAGKGNKALQNLGKGEDLFVQIADKTDPTRVAGQLTAARSTPLEGKRYRMELPRVWSFLKDGRTIYVEADSGQALIPDLAGSRPEDGAIQGHVIAKIFERSPDGSLPDPAKTKASFTLTSSELKFDLRAGEFRFPNAVKVTSERLDFEGRDVLILVDEASQHLDLLRVERTDLCVIRPQPASPRASTEPSRAASTVIAAAWPSPAPPAKGKSDVESFYELRIEGDPRVVQGARELTAEQLGGFVRLINNGLRPDAVAKTAHAATDDRFRSPTEPAIISTVAMTRTQPPSPESESTLAPIEMTWGGLMEFKAVRQMPKELARDDVFIKATSSVDAGVQVRDQEQRLAASGRLLQYFTTTQGGAIEGSDAAPAVLRKEGSGVASARRFDLDPTTGRVAAQGAGFIEGTLSPDQKDKRVAERLTWATGAEFIFGLEDGRMVSRLDRINLEGAIRAAGPDDAGGLSGDALAAEFTRTDRTTSYLSRVHVKGNAKAWDGRDSMLATDELDVQLAKGDDGSQSHPSSLKASGHVKASQKDATLAASRLEASLTQQRKSEGRFTTAVAQATASGDVNFTRADGVHAFTPLLTAKPAEQAVTLSGPGSWVGQNRTLIKGNTIAMRGDARTLTVEGSGEFTHQSDGKPASGAAAAQPPLDVRVGWARGMTYDDKAGLIVCTGSAQADLSRGSLEKDSVKAQQVTLAIGPETKSQGSPQPAKPEASFAATGMNRPLLWALAEGQTSPASIELRRYDPAQPATVTKLVYLEGGSIKADNVAGRVEVPGAGKLLAMDREEPASKTSNGPSGGGKNASMITRSDTQSKGTVLFGWSGSLIYERAEGKAIFREAVTVTHKSLSDGLVTQMRADLLTARLDEPAPATQGSSAPAGGGLKSAEAQGHVWLSARDSEMIADQLSFDAATATVDARADDVKSPVTLAGPQSASPLSARQIIWHLRDNGIRLIGTQPVVAPR